MEKTYGIYWDEIVRKSIDIKAKNKEEALKKFYNSSLSEEVFEIENEFVDGSLEIEEE
jgi:SpoVK/Ycf46/Vps4 family AAA+-type ATPase